MAEIEYNPRNAILFTQNLSDAYRYILKSQQEGVVTWREEVVSLEELERVFRRLRFAPKWLFDLKNPYGKSANRFFGRKIRMASPPTGFLAGKSVWQVRQVVFCLKNPYGRSAKWFFA